MGTASSEPSISNTYVMGQISRLLDLEINPFAVSGQRSLGLGLNVGLGAESIEANCSNDGSSSGDSIVVGSLSSSD